MAKDLLEYAKKDKKDEPKGASKEDLRETMGEKLFDKFKSANDYASFKNLVHHCMGE